VYIFSQGIKAVWSPNTGIVDWALVTEHYGKDFQQLGGNIKTDFPVTGFQEAKESATPGKENKHCVRITGAAGKVSFIIKYFSSFS